MSSPTLHCIVCGCDVRLRPGNRWLALNRWVVGIGVATSRQEARIANPDDPDGEDVYGWEEGPTDVPPSIVTACVPGCLALFAEMQCVEFEADMRRELDSE